MKQYRKLLPLIAALLVSACGGDSALPDPTGKASVRAINAISASSSIDFRIERLSLGTIAYRNVSQGARYDDFTYTFNFFINFAGDDEETLLASEVIDFVADQDYTLLVHGTVASPTITVWETTERTFDTGATVFQARFAHTSDLLAGTDVDVYFAPDGTAPVAGEQVATLSYLDISEPMDFEQDDYVVTLTTAGDVNDVLYTSVATPITSLSNIIVTPFDGTANDTAPVIVRALGAGGSEANLRDPSYGSEIQFMHASVDAGDVDIYDDEALTSLVVDDLTFREVTPEQPLTELEGTYTFTPFDNTGTVLTDREIVGQIGVRYRMILTGDEGEYNAVLTLPDRAPLDTAVKIIVRNESEIFEFVSVYAMDPGEVPDSESTVLRGGIPSGLGSQISFLAGGTYDLYLSDPTAESFTLISGPVPIDVALRDVLDFMVYDVVGDPSVADLVQIVETP